MTIDERIETIVARQVDERLARQLQERFWQVETALSEIRMILLRHEQILKVLPEGIRRMGFERGRNREEGAVSVDRH